jgi:hypothetical protein
MLRNEGRMPLRGADEVFCGEAAYRPTMDLYLQNIVV